MTTQAKPAPWRGRRRVEEPRERFIAVRCSDAEYATITAAAARAGLTTGAFLRTVALGTPGPRAARRPPVEVEVLARVLGGIGHVGSNVNQIAAAFHKTGILPTRDDMIPIAADIQAMRSAVMKALGRGN